ncbi:MAG: DinB family protein [Bacteroidota bacterium]|nr:DinB family protein [Bacteroidota bacterium]
MPINSSLIAELNQEGANTRKMIERVPDESLSWAPHNKSMTLGRLATHTADIPVWFERVINADVYDFAASNYKRDELDNIQDILNLFDERLAAAKILLENSTDDILNAPWTLRRGEQIYFTLPRKVSLRNFAFNHIYHHRGQLSVYLRLLDVPVPGMYGPTADEAILI